MDHDTGTGVAFIGSSLIVNPEGAVLGRAGSDDLLVVKSIDL